MHLIQLLAVVGKNPALFASAPAQRYLVAQRSIMKVTIDIVHDKLPGTERVVVEF